MTVEIFPSKASGRIKAPASKSMAHRLLICAALCDGTSTIRGINESEDILATIDCLRSLGAVCKINGDTVTVSYTCDEAAAEDAGVTIEGEKEKTVTVKGLK